MSGIEIPGIELLEKVGAGGMATVWKARQISLNRTVAVKILYSKFASDPSDVLRFQNEAQAAARLKHQGIVQVYDANVCGGMYYFIMEFIAGYTVGEWLKRRSPLPLKDALLAAECVADALRYAWQEAGIIHCDVKPDNILVDADGTVKVSDLGLARTLSQMRHDSESDEIMGTPAFMAPEQVLGEGELDFRADIYALGATLYQMVTGQTPFAGESPEAVMDLQVNGTLPDPIELVPELPPPVCWLIEKMMSKDPAGRQESWEAVIRDLERARKGVRPLGEVLPEGVSTVKRSPSRVKAFTPTAQMWERRKTGVAESLAKLVVVLLLAAGGVFLFLGWKSGRLNEWLKNPASSGALDDSGAAGAVPTMDDASQWQENYQQVVAWVEMNPGHWDEAASRLRQVAEGAAGTPYAAMARARLDALQRDKQIRVDAVMTGLKQRADVLATAMRWQAAAQVYASYAGELDAETAALRATRAAELQARAVAAPMRSLDDVLAGVAQDVLAGKFDSAVAALDEAAADPGHRDQADAVNAIRAEVAGARDLAARVLDSFVAQKGRTVQLELRTGVRQLRIKDVQGGRIVADVVGNGADASAQGTIEIEANFLSAKEHLRRMGGINQPGGKLYTGLVARDSGALDFAAQYFAQTPEPLATLLQSGTAKDSR